MVRQEQITQLRALLLKPVVIFVSTLMFVVAQIYVNAVALPSLHGQLDGMLILDVLAPYADGENFMPWDGLLAKDLFDALGASGREEYFIFAIGFEMLFSIIITPLFFMMILASLYKNQMVLVGVLPGIFDTLENGAVAILLAAYPDQPDWVITLGPTISALKVISMAVFAVVILLGLGIKVFARFGTRHT
jgi:hypothetical protein